jgi:hypothetical protein
MLSRSGVFGRLWDLNVINMERAKASLPVQENLDFAYLSKIRSQLFSTLTLTEELFPSAIKLFRLLHITKADTGFWYVPFLKISKRMTA